MNRAGFACIGLFAGAVLSLPAKAQPSVEADAAERAPIPADTQGSSTERERRVLSLQEQNSLDGSTGLLRVTEAGSGAAGTFRLSLIGSYFRASNFLCDGTNCPAPTSTHPETGDEVRRVGAHVGVSATFFPFLEGSFGLHSYATSNNQGSPKLLQALGDTNLGLKLFLPRQVDRILSFGAQANLKLLNGTGSVGLDGAATSFGFRALGTFDLSNRSDVQKRVPLRVHANLGYLFDNSGALVDETEALRNRRITRIERFGLAINRVDSLQGGIGIEGLFARVHPFAEWTIDVPVNRQGYTCNATAANAGEGCLANNAGFSSIPSRLSVGARVFPWTEGLAFLAAVDIGTGATHDFIEEVAPEMSWNAYLGLGYAVDTRREALIQRVEVEKRVAAPIRHEHYIVGRVIDRASGAAVANATLHFDGRPWSGFVSAEDGSFRSFDLEPGNYTFDVSAPGYRPGQCLATLPAGASVPLPAPSNPTQVPAAPPDSGSSPGGQAFNTASGDTVVNVDCKLDALPKVGNIVGEIFDAETNAPVGNSTVKITDRLARELQLTTDASGAFRFENVPPGPVKISVDAAGYLTTVTELDIQARQDVRAHITVNKRPNKPNVVLTTGELKLRRQVHFQTDSAEIMPDSSEILEELADVLRKHTELRSVEIQGHTDNTGTPGYNQRLSQERAEAVVTQLERLGVDRGRMQAKGYGQEKPLVPNNSEANRARNRRVQIIITKKD